MTELADMIITGAEHNPVRVCIYGVHGVGKTTFGAGSPTPIILRTEDGADQVAAHKLPLCRSLGDVQQQIRMLINERHDYQTLVVDSLDWLERLIHQQIATDYGVATVADVDYGRGYVAANREMAKILRGLEILRGNGLHILLIAHSKSEIIKCPINGEYSRYSLDLHKSASGLVDQWCDVLGFAHFGVRVVADESKKQPKQLRRAVGGKRILGFSDSPAYDAKRRLRALPDEMELDANKFWELTL